MRRALRIAAFIGAATAVLAMANCAGRFFRIDSCLDGGGRWDYDAQACKTAVT
jgi:hypothetical protein